MAKNCLHCQEINPDLSSDFCCNGCEKAYELINNLGLKTYYQKREIDPNIRKLKPQEQDSIDLQELVVKGPDNQNSLNLVVEGLHCGACVWLIETILKKQPNVTSARINLMRKTLFLQWQGSATEGTNLVKIIQDIGYKLLPFDEKILQESEKKYDDSIVRALAVAGFGMGNIMLFSLAFWFYNTEEMGQQTRNLLYFFSALIALPVIIFSSKPFFSSALKSIKAGFPNMDLAISIAIFLASIVSFFEIFNDAPHTYFDSVVMLIFFLLIGRYLDNKARKKAFAVATEFTLLSASFGRVLDNGKIKVLASKNLQKDMILLVAAGEKIAADGLVIEGESEVDNSLISGESLPKKVIFNSSVFGGTINLNQPIKVKITQTPNNSLLSKIAELTQEVENNKNSYVRLADRLAKIYLPAVHLIAFITFIFWFKNGFETALMNATAVLIITCPCALALAVPIVQTILISNFIKRGILVKSGEALEKLDQNSIIIFDKTGSVTLGLPKLEEIYLLKNNQKIALSAPQKTQFQQLAASLASASKHPLSQALVKSFEGEFLALKIHEEIGQGLSSQYQNLDLKLGKREFCQISNYQNSDSAELKVFLKYGQDEIIFTFSEQLKEDAVKVVQQLKQTHQRIILLSGDQKKSVEEIAQKLQITEFFFAQTPLDKLEFLKKLKSENNNLIMVGDGLNDAPALSLADVSISFSAANDLAQNIADIVIQSDRLEPILDLFNSAKKSLKLMRQNLLIALIYNSIAVPFAIMGYVVPLIAAMAMSSSSLLVLLNSLRMNSKQPKKIS